MDDFFTAHPDLADISLAAEVAAAPLEATAESNQRAAASSKDVDVNALVARLKAGNLRAE